MKEGVKYFEFDLKPQQVKAFAGLQNFVEKSSDKIFILKGVKNGLYPPTQNGDIRSLFLC